MERLSYDEKCEMVQKLMGEDRPLTRILNNRFPGLRRKAKGAKTK